MSDQLPTVNVTTTTAPAAVELQLAVISTKLDVLIEQRTDHEVRLRRLEAFRWVLLGAALVSGPATTALAQQLAT